LNSIRSSKSYLSPEAHVTRILTFVGARSVEATQRVKTIARSDARCREHRLMRIETTESVRRNESTRRGATHPGKSYSLLRTFCGRRQPQSRDRDHLDDRLVDTLDEGFDAGIRLGESLHDGMTAVKIKPRICFAVVGSSAFFKENLPSRTPSDLKEARNISRLVCAPQSNRCVQREPSDGLFFCAAAKLFCGLAL
jgi:DNA-binding transcriptional LysR family regulator